MLGFALGDAVSELKKAGYDVAVVEVSAKKRIDGGEGRVIRQRKLQDGLHRAVIFTVSYRHIQQSLRF